MVYLKLLFQIHNLINGVSHTFIFSEGENIIAKHIIYRQVYIVAKHIVLIYLQVSNVGAGLDPPVAVRRSSVHLLKCVISRCEATRQSVIYSVYPS